MENFDVDLALRLALDSKKAEKSDSMILYTSNLGVVKKKHSLKSLYKDLRNINLDLEV